MTGEFDNEVFHIGDAAPAPPADIDRMGFKAYNLARMSALGLRVPPAFVLSTAMCREHLAARLAPARLADLLAAHVKRLEDRTGLGLGSFRKPLLVSVRSGAAVSMPGMMETLLNVGLTTTTVRGLVRMTGNPRLAWDSYRRLIQSFAEVVHGAPAGPFEHALSQALTGQPHGLDFQGLARLAETYLDLFRRLTGRDFPQDPMEQLTQAAGAVFDSWDSDKAREYRRLNRLPEDLGTAVTVQAMVFGNTGGGSGSGVAFTRDPSTGEDRLYLDFLFNAQGEDVVSGRHALSDTSRLPDVLPRVAQELLAVSRQLEGEFRDLQEFEFTVQEGVLWLLQTRSGKRTPWARLVAAVEQARQGIISREEALDHLEGLDLKTLSRQRLATPAGTPLARAVAASPGVAGGAIALDTEGVHRLAGAGRHAILVREDIATADIGGIAAAAGILTAVGGRTSHAAVVARQMDKVCLVGCRTLSIEPELRRVRLGETTLAEGEMLTLDGETGEVWAGTLETVTERPETWLAELAAWGAS